MKKNVGNWDRLIRIAVGIVLAVLVATHVLSGWGAVIGSIIAVVLLLTALLNFCPAYSLTGVNTCSKD